MDAGIEIDSGDKSALAGVPADRVATVEKSYQPVFAKMRQHDVRYVLLGNGLYPTPARAKQFGLTEAELSKLFWDGVNADYTRLQATGRKVKEALASAREIRVTNPNGTDVKAGILKRPVMVGDGVISDEKRKEGGARVGRTCRPARSTSRRRRARRRAGWCWTACSTRARRLTI